MLGTEFVGRRERSLDLQAWEMKVNPDITSMNVKWHMGRPHEGRDVAVMQEACVV